MAHRDARREGRIVVACVDVGGYGCFVIGSGKSAYLHC